MYAIHCFYTSTLQASLAPPPLPRVSNNWLRRPLRPSDSRWPGLHALSDSSFHP